MRRPYVFPRKHSRGRCSALPLTPLALPPPRALRPSTWIVGGSRGKEPLRLLLRSPVAAFALTVLGEILFLSQAFPQFSFHFQSLAYYFFQDTRDNLKLGCSKFKGFDLQMTSSRCLSTLTSCLSTLTSCLGNSEYIYKLPEAV